MAEAVAFKYVSLVVGDCLIRAKQSSPPSVPGNEGGRYNFPMRSRSDTLYKQLFAHPEMVRELLAGFLPAPWARSLQVSALERVNASYAGERGKQRHQDMVWRAHIGGDWVYVYILLEFQSRSDRWMAFVERMKKPDMAPARDSLTRWLPTTLQEEFSETNIDFGEEPTMLFNKRFKTYEDLLEYEAIEKGRIKGLEEGRQEGRQEGQRLALLEMLDAQGVTITHNISGKIAAADLSQLSAWIRELAGGQAPDDLLTAANHPGA
jgi:hypothetical protein